MLDYITFSFSAQKTCALLLKLSIFLCIVLAENGKYCKWENENKGRRVRLPLFSFYFSRIRRAPISCRPCPNPPFRLPGKKAVPAWSSCRRTADRGIPLPLRHGCPARGTYNRKARSSSRGRARWRDGSSPCIWGACRSQDRYIALSSSPPPARR